MTETSLRVDLNLPPGHSQSAFLAQFNAALRGIQISGTATAHFAGDRSFVATSTSNLRSGGDEYNLTLTLYTGPDGTLTHLEAKPLDSPGESWRTFISTLVTSALARALSGQTTRHFQRAQVAYIGGHFAGEYWIGGFRLGPALQNEPDPHFINAERILYLDYCVDATDHGQAFTLSHDFLRTQLARLSFLLDFPVQVPDQTMRWVQPGDIASGQVTPSVRLTTLFRPPSFPPPGMPRKGALSPLARFSGSLLDPWRLTAIDPVSLPTETRSIYRALSRNEPLRRCVDDALRLYTLGLLLRRHSTTACLAYRVASIDAVCKALGSSLAPPAFMRTYLPESARPGNLVDILWGDIRSAHFHAGQAPLDDIYLSPFAPMMSMDTILASNIADEGLRLTRLALARWLLEAVAAEA